MSAKYHKRTLVAPGRSDCDCELAMPFRRSRSSIALSAERIAAKLRRHQSTLRSRSPGLRYESYARCYSRFSAALEAEVAPRAAFGERGTTYEPPSKGVAVQLIEGTHVGCQFRRPLGLEEGPDGAFEVIDAKVELLRISLNVLVHEFSTLTVLLRLFSPETHSPLKQLRKP